MQRKIRIQVLGFFAITVDGEPTENLMSRSPRGVSLLVRLILEQGKPVPTEQLIREMWGAEQTASHRSAIKTRICRLRGLLEEIAPGLGECVCAERRAYRYQPLENVSVDVLEMLDLVEKMQGKLTQEEKEECCRRIMVIYQGEPYLPVGTVDDVIKASYLRESYCKTSHVFAALLRESGEERRLIAVCRQALLYDPLDESLRAELMRALVRVNRPREAAQEYAQAVRFSHRLLDSEPGEELQACRRELMLK